MHFGHSVQRAAVLEPLQLTLVEGVAELDVECLAAVRWVHAQRYGLAYRQLCDQQVNFVIRLDLVVVCRVGERERKHALLLKIGFVLVVIMLVQTFTQLAMAPLTIRANDLVIIARPPRCLGSRAACSRDEPSP